WPATAWPGSSGGMGIAGPTSIPPLVAAAVAIARGFRRAPPVAQVSVRAPIGADLVDVTSTAALRAPIVSMGSWRLRRDLPDRHHRGVADARRWATDGSACP